MKSIGTLILIIMFIGITNAQELVEEVQEIDEKVFKNELGVHAGASTGLGFSYRRWFKNEGIQLTTMATVGDRNTFVSFGATLLHSVKQSKKTRVYAYLGNHIMSSNNNNLIHVIGLGGGFSTGKLIKFNFMFGFGRYNDHLNVSLAPVGALGLYHVF